MIRKVIPTDIADITAIYNYYIKNTCITFETELVTEEEMSRRMKQFILITPTWSWKKAEN